MKSVTGMIVISEESRNTISPVSLGVLTFERLLPSL